jgi:hypothetical protein
LPKQADKTKEWSIWQVDFFLQNDIAYVKGQKTSQKQPETRLILFLFPFSNRNLPPLACQAAFLINHEQMLNLF